MTNTSRHDVVIVGSVRTPFARGNTAYVDLGNRDLLTPAMKALVDKFDLRGEQLGAVASGAVMKHPRDWGLSREAAFSSGLNPHTAAYDVQMACGTSLLAVTQLAHRIALGEIESGIAGGADTASNIPIAYSRRLQQIFLKSARGKTVIQRARPWLSLRPRDIRPAIPGVAESRTGLSMGEHCEIMAKEWNIGRLEQDQFAYTSHMNAAAAWREAFYDDLVIPFTGLCMDNNVRSNTSLDQLAKLNPVFDRTDRGTLTAGNSTPLTDGAACVLLASEAWAKSRSLPIQAYITQSAVAAVDFAGLVGPAEGLLMAPTYAVPKMLDRAGITLQDFDIYEIHEAFAAQVLCTLKAWESAEYCKVKLGRESPLGTIDRTRLNLKGGSIALGHPFAATGARIVGSLAKQLALKGSGRGLISVCTASGMGITAILER